jgi:hypothetical protein
MKTAIGFGFLFLAVISGLGLSGLVFNLLWSLDPEHGQFKHFDYLIGFFLVFLISLVICGWGMGDLPPMEDEKKGE